MKTRHVILFLLCSTLFQKQSFSQQTERFSFDFYGQRIEFELDKRSIEPFDGPLSAPAISQFYASVGKGDLSPLIETLTAFREKNGLDDWLYYQLVRKTAQQISPKADNYYRYTLYKWLLITKSGYTANLKVSNQKLLFYIQTEDSIYNLPCYFKNNRQYVCLNYHDYGGKIDFDKEVFTEVALPGTPATKDFSYKVTRLPLFQAADYEEKDLQFTYNEREYHFRIKLNPKINTIFANYPVVDYASYFNIPLSDHTYSSLIPSLKKELKGKNIKNGIDYLMHFTRYAFLFQRDSEVFGAEKRLSPEQTLLYAQSDCEDRAALFFYLVKEIYNLPMIVIAFADHVTVAVKFDKPVGRPVIFNGIRYSVCEPTPQQNDLSIGELLPSLRKESYQVVYAYTPSGK